MPAHNVVAELNAAETSGDAVVSDFGSEGISADVIAESTSAAGVTVDGVSLKDGSVTSTGTVSSVNVYVSTGDLGYIAGAGGTVTQATSKSTGVTLSKRCGTITTHNAALAAGAEVTFTVTNTVVAATDVIILSIQAGGTPGEYAVNVTAVAAGSFDITVTNRTAGSLSDAIAINFAVIKSVAA